VDEREWTPQQQAWLDALDGKTYKKMPDEYAGQRCTNCYPHLVYADEQGKPCRFCDCTSHVAKAAAEGGEAA